MKAWILLLTSFLWLNLSHAQVDPRASARQELNLGVQAYKSAQFDDAIEHFKRAALLDPEMKNAHLYLATVYAQMFVPEVDTEENVANGKNAIEQYLLVQRMDPDNVIAAKAVGSLNLHLKHFKEARDSYKKAAAIDPNDPENFYGAGVVDWTMAYREIAPEKDKLQRASQNADDAEDNDSDDDKAAANPKPDSDPEYAMIFSPVCASLRAEHLGNIEDGIAMLTHAIDLRKDYDDAMVYMNLLFRLRADLECGDKAAHDKDVERANGWSDMAMAARKKKMDEAAKKSQAPAGAPPR